MKRMRWENLFRYCICDMVYRIREAKDEDLKAIAALFRDTVGRINSRDYAPVQVKAWQDKATPERWRELWNSGLLFFVADGDKEGIVGFASVNTDGYVHSMFVGYGFEGFGIASSLLAAVEKYAKEHGAVKLTSEVSITARSFFEKRGYRVVRKQNVVLNDVVLVNFLMCKEDDR